MHEQDKEIRSNGIGFPPKQQALTTIQKHKTVKFKKTNQIRTTKNLLELREIR